LTLQLQSLQDVNLRSLVISIRVPIQWISASKLQPARQWLQVYEMSMRLWQVVVGIIRRPVAEGHLAFEQTVLAAVRHLTPALFCSPTLIPVLPLRNSVAVS
jgi:hypothetical protein